MSDHDERATEATATPTDRARAAGPAILPSRYEDLGVVGRGGWGEVRRARDVAMDRTVVLKILAWEHLDSASVRSRFQNEARVTASLDHPGIVPVIDSGVLADGRPWFAMKEVRGRTLAEILREGRDTHEQSSERVRLRRLVDILRRVAETVGSAHERRVVHRDLKPANVMVGSFGEVYVLDWGIAHFRPESRSERPPAESADETITEAGRLLGTLGYVSPEQARGEVTEASPASDVYSLGLILFEILTGVPARRGPRARVWAAAIAGRVPVPAAPEFGSELVVVCDRALRSEPSARFENAMTFADALRDWLDGSARALRAAAAVEVAAAMAPDIDALRARRAACLAEASRVRSDVRGSDPIERKLPLWALEDEAESLDRQLATLEETRIETLRGALEHEPSYLPAHAALAKTFRERLESAERNEDRSEAARLELLLRRHDRGEHVAFLRGLGRVDIDSEPRGAIVHAFRYVVRERRLVREPLGPVGTTPVSVELPAGSYVMELHREGLTPALYPVRIGRDERWDTRRPGTGDSTPIALQRDLAPNEVYVPAGWTRVGGDRLSAEPVAEGRVWIDGFVIQRFPVTCREYLAFLDDLLARGRSDEAWRHAPRLPLAASGGSVPSVEIREGRFALTPDEQGLDVDPDCPIASIDWHAAKAYAAWWSEKTSQSWRLPNELEWEKAARGVDGRAFPWGAEPEPTWACILGSTDRPPQRSPVGAHVVDESPYGVRGMAGNVRDWCINVWKHEGPATVDGIVQLDPAADDEREPRAIRGGAWTSVVAFARCAGRFAAKPDERFAVVGLRLVRSV